jgi:CRISPR/Cas system CSM-associated protein Csm2 small subunit
MTELQASATLTAAIIAAVSSFLGVFFGGIISFNNHNKTTRLRLAENYSEHVEKIRDTAPTYIGHLSVYTEYFESSDEFSKQDYKSIVFGFTKSINLLGLLLDRDDDQKLSDWHDQVIKHISDEEYDDANDAIANFTNFLAPIIAEYDEIVSELVT